MPRPGRRMSEIILSLCDFSGVWSDPYRDRYDVVRIDLQHGEDVRLFEHKNHWKVRGILCAPPCDSFAVSGARWWGEKGPHPLLDGLSTVDACLRAVTLYRPAWWALENPVGRLRKYLGPHVMTFNPSDYGGQDGDDPYTKRTCLWGEFTPPQKNPTFPHEGSKMHRIGPGPERKNIRSRTPQAFAEAFAMANP